MTKTLPPTDGMHYREGYKAMLDRKPWSVKIPDWFRVPPDFCGHWSERHVTVDAYPYLMKLTLAPQFLWNFANWFPDFDWIRVPSGAHDALLSWREAMIADGLLTEGSPEDRALKEDIDTVFVLLCRERLPKCAKLTPRGLFIGVNRLSRIAPGSQAEDHKVRWVR